MLQKGDIIQSADLGGISVEVLGHCISRRDSGYWCLVIDDEPINRGEYRGYVFDSEELSEQGYDEEIHSFGVEVDGLAWYYWLFDFEVQDATIIKGESAGKEKPIRTHFLQNIKL